MGLVTSSSSKVSFPFINNFMNELVVVEGKYCIEKLPRIFCKNRLLHTISNISLLLPAYYSDSLRWFINQFFCGNNNFTCNMPKYYLAETERPNLGGFFRRKFIFYFFRANNNTCNMLKYKQKRKWVAILTETEPRWPLATWPKQLQRDHHPKWWRQIQIRKLHV